LKKLFIRLPTGNSPRTPLKTNILFKLRGYPLAPDAATKAIAKGIAQIERDVRPVDAQTLLALERILPHAWQSNK
jgi:hypothetical protein